MNQVELLTARASTLTRKQRKERAALKRMIEAAGPARRPGAYVWGQAIEVDDVPLHPRPGHVFVRLDGRTIDGRIAHAE